MLPPKELGGSEAPKIQISDLLKKIGQKFTSKGYLFGSPQVTKKGDLRIKFVDTETLISVSILCPELEPGVIYKVPQSFINALSALMEDQTPINGVKYVHSASPDALKELATETIANCTAV
jgi:hypothetical protein